MADDADTADRQLSTPGDPGDVASAEAHPDRDSSGDGELIHDIDVDDVAATDKVDETEAWSRRGTRGLCPAAVVGVVTIAITAALAAWLGVQAHAAEQRAQQRALFLSVGTQSALNLTTIKAAEADADVQRILDSSTGVFHNDFQKRSGPFVDLVKQTQSSSEGTVTEAAVESATDDAAQILVSVSVKTTTPGAASDQPPRLWRMRLNVEKAAGGAKVSDVAFVP